MSRRIKLSSQARAKNLEALTGQTFDVLVIGGGVTGAGVARDAALRGLSVALVERKDFAAGTSSRSSKLIHGGLRYLQQGDVGLVREAATERHTLRKLVPHLVRPQQLIVPVSSRGGYAKIKVGLFTFDRLAGVAKDEQYRMLSKEETLDLEPLLRSEDVYGGGLYYEYLTDDARLVLEVVKSAAALGAVAANYAEVTAFTFENGRVSGAVVEDRFTGEELRVQARVVVNAAGPWVDRVRLLCEHGEQPKLHLTKGIHLGLRRERLPVSRIIIMTARDRRSVFAIPYNGVTYIGTTDTNYSAPEDYPLITMDDVSYLLEAATRTFQGEPLSPDDIVSAWAGLRPLLHEEGKAPSEISRKDEIMTGASGLLSVAGGKLTTFRRMAERIVDLVCDRLRAAGQTVPERIAESAQLPLSGGDTGDDVAAFARRLQTRWPEVGEDVVEHLVRLYGSNAELMVEGIAADPLLGARCAPDLPVTRAEVEYAMREEMAVTLEDLLERRSRLLLWDPDNGLHALQQAARWMAAALDWDAHRIEREIGAYRELVRQLNTFDADSAPAEPLAQVAQA